MLKLAVVGKDVSASLSPRMHTMILSAFREPCTYDKVSVSPADFALRAGELFETYDAFNVTIPFKGEIVGFLKELRGDAQIFGAVNTVVSRERAGYNTDGYGFLCMLENADVSPAGKRALVLGAGGAGRSVIRKLADAGADVFAYDKDPARLAACLNDLPCFVALSEVPLAPYDIIVNCTGVGMHETVGMTPEAKISGLGKIPVGRELLGSCETAVDLIYEPARSEFLRVAADCGKKIVSGGAMLFYQAYCADCIFLGKTPCAQEAKRLYKKYLEESR